MSKQAHTETEKMILASEMIGAEYHEAGWVFFDRASNSYRICLNEVAEYELARLFDLVNSLDIVLVESGVHEMYMGPKDNYSIWFADGLIFPICDENGKPVINI